MLTKNLSIFCERNQKYEQKFSSFKEVIIVIFNIALYLLNISIDFSLFTIINYYY